jgi:small subunit ribosomal protein S1
VKNLNKEGSDAESVADGYMKIGEHGELVPNYDMTLINFEEGDVLRGRVVRVDRDEVLVDIGFKSEGVIPPKELSVRYNVNPTEVISVNDEIDVMVLQKEDQDGRLILSKKRAETERAFRELERTYREDGNIVGEVIEIVKGGLILDIGLRGFLPASLVDIKRVKNLRKFIGEKLECKIVEFNRFRNNVVLSRKAYLEKSLKVTRKSIIEGLSIGQVKKGVISNIVDFGAFVDLGGIDGLIHISELSWNHINHPSEVVIVGDEVDVVILDIDKEKERVSLGLKQTQKDPWVEVAKKFSKGDLVAGKICKIVPFGIFVEIGDGIEGLVHISELSSQHVTNPEEVCSIGDEVDVCVVDIDLDRRRIGLSIKKAESQDSQEARAGSEEAKGKKPPADVSEGMKELKKEIKEDLGVEDYSLEVKKLKEFVSTEEAVTDESEDVAKSGEQPAQSLETILEEMKKNSRF